MKSPGSDDLMPFGRTLLALMRARGAFDQAEKKAGRGGS